MSAARALEAFTKICDKNVVDMIIASVATVLNSDNPNHQQATVILFSTICEYPDRNYTHEMFQTGFQHFFALLNSQHKVVVKNSMIGFIRLAESLPEVFLNHPNIAEIVTTIMGFVNVEIQEIRYIAIQILANMSEGLKENPAPVSEDPNILLTKIVGYYAENM